MSKISFTNILQRAHQILPIPWCHSGLFLYRSRPHVQSTRILSKWMDDVHRVSGRVTAVLKNLGIFQASSYSGMAPILNDVTPCPRRRGIENLVRSRIRTHDRVGAGNSICRSAVTTGGGNFWRGGIRLRGHAH